MSGKDETCTGRIGLINILYSQLRVLERMYVDSIVALCLDFFGG